MNSKKSGKTTLTVGGAQGAVTPLDEHPIADATIEVAVWRSCRPSATRCSRSGRAPWPPRPPSRRSQTGSFSMLKRMDKWRFDFQFGRVSVNPNDVGPSEELPSSEDL